MAGGHLVLLVLRQDPLPPGAGRHLEEMSLEMFTFSYRKVCICLNLYLGTETSVSHHHEVSRVLVLQQQGEGLPGPLARLQEVLQW